MAELHKYKCKKCGNEIVATESPYIHSMVGLYAQCYCKKCDKLVTVEAGSNYQVDVTKLKLHCEHCKETVSVWTPDMGCPRCGEAMKRNEQFSI